VRVQWHRDRSCAAEMRRIVILGNRFGSLPVTVLSNEEDLSGEIDAEQSTVHCNIPTHLRCPDVLGGFPMDEGGVWEKPLMLAGLVTLLAKRRGTSAF
jgi:hypothetical protein